MQAAQVSTSRDEAGAEGRQAKSRAAAWLDGVGSGFRVCISLVHYLPHNPSALSVLLRGTRIRSHREHQQDSAGRARVPACTTMRRCRSGEARGGKPGEECSQLWIGTAFEKRNKKRIS